MVTKRDEGIWTSRIGKRERQSLRKKKKKKSISHGMSTLEMLDVERSALGQYTPPPLHCNTAKNKAPGFFFNDTQLGLSKRHLQTS